MVIITVPYRGKTYGDLPTGCGCSREATTSTYSGMLHYSSKKLTLKTDNPFS